MSNRIPSKPRRRPFSISRQPQLESLEDRRLLAILPPYVVDANTIQLWHFEQSSGSTAALVNEVATGLTLRPQTITSDGVATLNANISGAASAIGFGNAISTIGGVNYGVASSNAAGAISKTTTTAAPLVGPDGAFTFEAIIKTSDISSNQEIISMEDSGVATSRPFQFRINISGQLEFNAIAGGGQHTVAIPTSGADAFVANEWFHVAVTYNGVANSAGNLQFYWTRLDNSRVAANVIGSRQLTQDLSTDDAYFVVGNEGRNDAGENLRGSIDQVRISNIARGPGEFLFAQNATSTLNISNNIHRVSSLLSTIATLTGTSELHVTSEASPLVGSTIHLNSPDAWLFLENVLPSVVASTLLSQIRVNGAVAVLDANVQVVQYGVGTVVIPHSSTFQPLEVFTGSNFSGSSLKLSQYTSYDNTNLGTFNDNISSFKLKRGYMATIAQNPSGNGISQNYVAQDGDLEIPILSSALDNSVSFIRVFPWRWTTKKGIAGNIGQQLDTQWWYDWNVGNSSTLDREYVAIRQARWWPNLGQDWNAKGINHLLGYNEPDRPDQANLLVGDAIWSWPDLLWTGLRVGAPAVSDGGLAWLYDFMNRADAAGLRVDYVPVHYYRCTSPTNPSGAATQFYNFLKGIYDVVQRPIWVTEWNNGANWTTCGDPSYAQQQAAVSAMVNMLENTPFVERYALYNWVEDVRRVQWDDGSLTLAGESYRDVVSKISYRQEVPDPGTTPDAVYKFENNAFDTSGNGHVGMQVGAETFTTGLFGQAIQLDGQNDYLKLSEGLGDSTDFTFASWVKWDGGNSWQRIFDLGVDTNNYMFLSPSSSGGQLRFAIKNGGAEQQLSAPSLPVGNWAHVAVTISGNTGKMFVNGQLVATNNSMTINPSSLNTKDNYLGKSQFSADPLFAGTLDEVRFYGHALSDAEVAALADLTPASPTNLRTSSPATGQIRLLWNASPDASLGYRIFRSSSSGGPYTLVAQGITGTSYTDTGLYVGPSGTPYYYVAVAENAFAVSAYSNETTRTIYPPLPSAVANLALEPAGSGQSIFHWDADPYAGSYRVSRSNSTSGPFTLIASNVTSTRYVDSGLSNGTDYYYTVSAVNIVGQGAESTLLRSKPTDQRLYLAFDETSGTIASDASPNELDASVVNGGDLSATGIKASAINLDGVNDYVSMPIGVLENLNDFSISTWVNLNSVDTNSRIFDFGIGTTSFMFLTPKTTSNTARFGIFLGSTAAEINSTTPLTAGNWIHLAITLSGSVGIMYVNGTEVGRNSAMAFAASSLAATTNNYIGRSQSSSDPYLNGLVDDFRIYGRALSPTEVFLLKNLPPVALASSITADENVSKVFQIGDFAFADADNDPITSLTISNLQLAGGDTLTVDQGSGPIAVTNGMTITSAQIASMIYTPAADAWGTARSAFDFAVNDASLGIATATMTINVSQVVIPSVSSIQINDGTTSRSMISSLTVTFDTTIDHTALASAFLLTNITSGQQVSTLQIQPIDIGNRTVITITFNAGASVANRSGSGLLGNSLVDGNYRLDIAAQSIRSTTSNSAMASNYVFGGKTKVDASDVDKFFRLLGDANGDGAVNVVDRSIVSSIFLKPADYRSDLDTNGDGVINIIDRVGFSANFLNSRA